MHKIKEASEWLQESFLGTGGLWTKKAFFNPASFNMFKSMYYCSNYTHPNVRTAFDQGVELALWIKSTSPLWNVYQIELLGSGIFLYLFGENEKHAMLRVHDEFKAFYSEDGKPRYLYEQSNKGSNIFEVHLGSKCLGKIEKRLRPDLVYWRAVSEFFPDELSIWQRNFPHRVGAAELLWKSYKEHHSKPTDA